jgi:hypothetical protein
MQNFDDDLHYPRVTRNEFLSGSVRSSIAWARYAWTHDFCKPVSTGDSPASDRYTEMLDAFDRPIEALMVDVLCLLSDAGRGVSNWQFFTWAHMAGLLARHPLAELLRPLPAFERQEFEWDLAALGLGDPPSCSVTSAEQPQAHSPDGRTREELELALGQALIELHRPRWRAGQGWLPDEPDLTTAAKAFDRVWRAHAPALERLQLALMGLLLDAGRSHAAWQEQLWGHARAVLSQHAVSELVERITAPEARNALLFNLSHLKLCPPEIDPRLKPPF